ncbi:MAG TPA: acetyl-CoA C-acyltransferase [Candidatus Acidoferrales bacterium]|nr:acetyl-CoA C-acyltransferase [Candidatus Acidoferrales bacterium]HVC38791.1 acetyl-CoA C-acyltransferase [Candidatus Dormibacteraeota bacterium]
MDNAVIVDGVRTPIGRFGGALASERPDDLAALVLRSLVDRVGLDPKELEDVYLGCANQAGEDNRDVARMAVLLAGFPVEVGGCTVNRLCGSGLEAVVDAARAISHGDGAAIIGGGVESMSRAPWVTAKPDRGFARGERVLHDSALGWRFINPRMEALYGTESMGQTAENVSRMFSIGRAAQDRFALRSHLRALAAQQRGSFAAELVPVPTGRAAVDSDECPRADSSLEQLARLKPVFAADGSVTAGNSSPLNDGAAALLLTSAEFSSGRGLRPMAAVRSMAVAGVPPRLMGMGPIPATQKALERAGLALSDIGLIELNEAFAAQSLAVLQELGLDPEDDRVNPNGGAIALGHPLGCSGSRILVTLIHELTRRQLQFGLATMCIGVGQGIAVVVENLR